MRTLDDSGAVALRAYGGKPLVLNVWATWCPPCRRELPAFAQAQQAYPEVNFVFADQGERAEVVATYLRRQGLQLYNVLLDRSMATMRATGVKALPNTLFFDGRSCDIAATGMNTDTSGQIPMFRSPRIGCNDGQFLGVFAS